MNLVEQARKRLEEKKVLKAEYDEKTSLLSKLNREYKDKVEKKYIDLIDKSNIESLQEQIKEEQKNIDLKHYNYSKNLKKRMGLNKLGKSAENLYFKIYTSSVAISFKLQDLIEEIKKVSNKKYKFEIMLDSTFGKETYFIVRIKNCILNLTTTQLDNELKYSLVTNKKLDINKFLNVEFEIDDCGIVNFFEEETKNKTQQIVKQALINLSNKQELNNENNKNVD